MTETEGTASTTASASLVRQSRDKLEAVAETLKPWLISNDDDDDDDNNKTTATSSSSCTMLHVLPRVLTTQQQQAYRCKCSFQLVLHEENNNNNLVWRYAIRRDKQPIVIDSFPIANHQIQKAMHRLLKALNNTLYSSSNGNGSSNGSNNNMLFTQHLTSVSFSSPWQDDDDNDDIDIDSHSSSRSGSVVVVVVVVVTLHYDGPIADETSWKEQARSICQTCGFSQLTGRSKKVIVRAFQEEEEEEESTDREFRRRSPSSIYDTLWLEKQTNQEEASSSSSCWNVTFLTNNPDNMMSSQCTKGDDHDADDHDVDDDNGMMRIPVHYCKPEGAFFHPNASVMMLALKWLLNRVQYIIHATTATTANAHAHATAPQQEIIRRRPRLLELYCGCGAHTMPLALSRLFSHITALELDERLVRALKHNCCLNNLVTVNSNSSTNRKVQKDNGNQNDQRNDTTDDCATVVECISSDAGAWAREQHQQQQQKKRQQQWRQDNIVDDGSYSRNDDDDDLAVEYDILLVDPPRNGLDEQVCQLALHQNVITTAASFSHILYISCGKEALVRDLERLSAGYELVECALLDLFPQTEAVETLVHLQRRRR